MTEKLSQFTATVPTGSSYVAGANVGSPNQKYLVSDITKSSGTAGSILSTSLPLNFYVNAATGSDSNNGFTPGAAFKTINHAMAVANSYDFNFPAEAAAAQTGTAQNALQIHVADGTYKESVILANLMPYGILGGSLLGNPANPGNVIIDATGVPNTGHAFGNGAAIFGDSDMYWFIDGFRLKSNTYCIDFVGGPTVDFDDLVLDVSNVGVRLTFYSGAAFDAIGPSGITINNVGSPKQLFDMVHDSYFFDQGTLLTFTGPIHFSGSVFFVTDHCNCQLGTGTVVGGNNVTGSRYGLFSYSTLDIGSGNRSTALGSTVGAKDTTSTIVQDPLYQVFTPTGGTTVTPTPGNHLIILNPAGALATLTVNMPTNMSDAEIVAITTSQTITSLTIATTDGSTLVGAVTTLAAGASTAMMFDANNTTWYPAGAVR